MVSGVLPVPPAVRLPTTTTGAAMLWRLRQPRRYSARRNAIAAAYSGVSTRACSGGEPVPYQ
ncbi:hypothetical protein NB689_002721 [Xanthomonas sacchari]|nr:hypothetical protein [Xanthomonas sacchari]